MNLGVGLTSYSLELINLVYQPWYSVFLSVFILQQNSISRLISRKNHQPNNLLGQLVYFMP
jgi:hypothetical protein